MIWMLSNATEEFIMDWRAPFAIECIYRALDKINRQYYRSSTIPGLVRNSPSPISLGAVSVTVTFRCLSISTGSILSKHDLLP